MRRRSAASGGGRQRIERLERYSRHCPREPCPSRAEEFNTKRRQQAYEYLSNLPFRRLRTVATFPIPRLDRGQRRPAAWQHAMAYLCVARDGHARRPGVLADLSAAVGTDRGLRRDGQAAHRHLGVDCRIGRGRLHLRRVRQTDSVVAQHRRGRHFRHLRAIAAGLPARDSARAAEERGGIYQGKQFPVPVHRFDYRRQHLQHGPHGAGAGLPEDFRAVGGRHRGRRRGGHAGRHRARAGLAAHAVLHRGSHHGRRRGRGRHSAVDRLRGHPRPGARRRVRPGAAARDAGQPVRHPDGGHAQLCRQALPAPDRRGTLAARRRERSAGRRAARRDGGCGPGGVRRPDRDLPVHGGPDVGQAVRFSGTGGDAVCRRHVQAGAAGIAATAASVAGGV